MTYQYWTAVILRAITVILIVIAGYYVIKYAFPLLYPFIIGWLIAMMIEPIVRWLERRGRVPRWLSVTLLLIVLFGLIFSLLSFLIAEIVVELTHLANRLPTYFNQVQQFIVDLFTKENNSIKKLIDALQGYFEKNPDQQKQIAEGLSTNVGIIANKGTTIITDLLTRIGQFVSDLPFIITVLIFIILAAFFIGMDWPRLKTKSLSIIPDKIQNASGLVLLDLKKALVGFLRAQLILITITAAIMLTGLLILQVPYAITIALLIGLVDLLPYLGVGAVVVPWIIYLFFVGNFSLGIGLSIVYIVILVIRQFLEPKLLATTVGLDPLLTLIAIFIGINMVGVLGIIIGPIVVVILLALHRAGVFHDIWRFVKGSAPQIKKTTPSD